MFKFLYDGQGIVRQAILYSDRSCPVIAAYPIALRKAKIVYNLAFLSAVGFNT